MLKTKLPKLFILSFILFCHIFSMLIPTSAAMGIYTANMKNKDIAPICSGNGQMRWIKLSDYYETGKLSFIEQPASDVPSEQEDNSKNSCSICSIYKQLDNHSTGLIAHDLVIENITSEAPLSFLQHFTKRSSLSPSSRDPPFLT
ncbi:hypothetical protein ACPUVO_02315 [Pseudocolwellia sp. HL-MZ19]|uniref:hypothetical protein n=1 Tax=Pseudocolwellia sp. HL-MZ19 TaxID=3400846 RepID=UPI003CEA8424